MFDTTSLTINGVDYELLTPIAMTQDSGYRVVQANKSGEIKVLTDYNSVPEGWSLISSVHPELRQFALIDEIEGLTRTHGKGGSRTSDTPIALDPLTTDHFLPIEEYGDTDTDSSGRLHSLTDAHCLIARRKGQLVGVIKFDPRKTAISTYGYIDRGVVSASERKNAQSGRQKTVSDHLMLLSIATLINNYKAQSISTSPGTKQGERYARNHGFVFVGEERAFPGTFDLSEEIITAVKQFLATQKNDELPWSRIQEVAAVLDRAITEAMTETTREVSIDHVR